MKNSHTFTNQILLAACFLLFSHAAIASFLPTKLDKNTILFQVENSKNKNNPNAGISYILHFNKDTYHYKIPGIGKIISGHYSYKRSDLNNAIALLDCHELYDNKKSDYSILLNAADKSSGLYIYKQTQGAVSPQKRMNFGYYQLNRGLSLH